MSETRIGIAMMLLSYLLFLPQFPLLESISRKLYDYNFILRGSIKSEKDVVIAAIDEKSLKKLGRWPWSRSIMTDLIDRLKDLDAGAIGLDIVFSEPEIRPDYALATDIIQKVSHAANPQTAKLINYLKESLLETDVDAIFSSSLKRAGMVVGGYFFYTLKKEIEGIDLEYRQGFKHIKKSRFPTPDFPTGKTSRDYLIKKAVGVKPNIALIGKAVHSNGFFSIVPDGDGVVRRVINIIRFKLRNFPHLSLQTLAAYRNSTLKIVLNEKGIRGFEVGESFIPSDENGLTLINFYGEEKTAPTLSISDILGGDISKQDLLERIANKIVFIGPTALAVGDIRDTPFGTMPGVEIHAQYTQNIIDGKTLIKNNLYNYIFNTVSIFLVSSILMLNLKKSTPFSGFFAAIGLIFIFFALQYYMFLHLNMVFSVFYVFITIILVYTSMALYKYSTESREKRFIKSAFSQYLSPAVISTLISDPSKLELGGVRKNMTAFFSDVAGFSSISEKLSPDELVALLNEYLTAMTDILLQYGGTIDKYEGDAIIAFFGAPVDQEDHARRCCLASINMQTKLVEMRTDWAKKGKAELNVRIGINSGPMVVGNMGSLTRMDYTIMGDSVNLASRLEGANKQYGSETMVGEGTYEASRNYCEFRELDLLRVVGKQQPVRVYELICQKGKLSESKKQIVNLYHQGILRYRDAQWDKAIQFFSQTLDIDPRDGPALTYLERCLEYQQNPPDKNWGGVYTMTTK